MFKSNKNVFWEALLVTIIIFGLGVMAGFVLENWRNSKVETLYQNSEVGLLDVKVQSEVYTMGNFDCEFAFDQNIEFADRIYEEAKTLERYQKSAVLTENIIINHRKYDLLRTLLFLNSIKIKEKCNSSYFDVVYFYKFRDQSQDVLAKEQVFSKLLGELKDKMGDKILLIPIGVEENISSVQLLMNRYNISSDELPVILINEKIKLTEVQTVEDLEKNFK